jgi:hypothetical protein
MGKVAISIVSLVVGIVIGGLGAMRMGGGFIIQELGQRFNKYSPIS